MKKKTLFVGIALVAMLSLVACKDKETKPQEMQSAVSEELAGEETIDEEVIDEEDVNEDVLDEENTNEEALAEKTLCTDACSAYKNVLKNYIDTGMLEQLDIDFNYDLDTNTAYFSLCDLNEDGKEELVVYLESSYETVIYSFDTENGLNVMYTGGDNVGLYSNGYLKDYWNHNQGMFGSKWPYTVAAYNELTGEYDPVMYVDGYDKIWCESEGSMKGEGGASLFPSDIDSDKNGYVYVITKDGNEITIDDAEYNKEISILDPSRALTPVRYEVNAANVEKISPDLAVSESFWSYVSDRTDGFTAKYNEEDESLFYSTEDGPILQPDFRFYDVNRDGREDLIVSGAFGIRQACCTEIVLNTASGLKTYCFSGTPISIKDNYMYIDASDYGGAGEEYYTVETVVRFNEMLGPEVVLSHYVHELIDFESGDATIESESFGNGYAEISKEEYDRLFETYMSDKKTDFGDITSYLMTASNCELLK